MKKEVSDHLAKAFFETRQPIKKIQKEGNFLFFLFLSAALLTVLALGVNFVHSLAPNGVFTKSESLMLERHGGPYRLKFDFTDKADSLATLNIEMPDIDLNGFKRIGFLARLQQADAKRLGALKVSLVNNRRETSSLYISEINQTWKKVVVSFSSFDKLQDKSHLYNLFFTLEPWNVDTKKGELLIEDIQFLKN